MNKYDANYHAERRAELLAVARSMLEGQMDLIEGVRRISRLRFELGEEQGVVFLPIVGIDSETDHFPLGDARQRWALEALKRADQEKEDYLLGRRGVIASTCAEIIRAFK